MYDVRVYYIDNPDIGITRESYDDAMEEAWQRSKKSEDEIVYVVNDDEKVEAGFFRGYGTGMGNYWLLKNHPELFD